MKPISPIIAGLEQNEVRIAETQDEYQTLPALPVDGGQYLVTRWRLTWRERIRLLCEGSVYLSIWTFGRPLQPVLLEVDPPDLKMIPTDEQNESDNLDRRNMGAFEREYVAARIARLRRERQERDW